jgi:hypothetical protein
MVDGDSWSAYLKRVEALPSACGRERFKGTDMAAEERCGVGCGGAAVARGARDLEFPAIVNGPLVRQ